MGPLNEWQILELGHFEVGNFEKKMCFLTTGGARTPFKGLNESTNHKLLFAIHSIEDVSIFKIIGIFYEAVVLSFSGTNSSLICRL